MTQEPDGTPEARFLVLDAAGLSPEALRGLVEEFVRLATIVEETSAQCLDMVHSRCPAMEPAPVGCGWEDPK